MTGEEGSALVLVLVMVTVLSLLTGTVMAVYLVQFRFIRRDVQRVQALYAAEAAVYEAMARLEAEPDWRPDEAILILPSGLAGTVSVTPFGGYLRVTTAARVGHQRAVIAALVGEVPPPAFSAALALGDSLSGLVLAGEATIRGDVHAGPLGVQPGLLPGIPFTGLFDGAALPLDPADALRFEDTLYRDFLDRLDLALAAAGGGGGGGIQGADANALPNVVLAGPVFLSDADSATFRHPLRLLVLGDLALGGTLTLPEGTEVAAGTISVSGSVRSDGALLYGEKGVRVGGRARLVAHLLSARRVEVADDAYLLYPSTLYVQGVEEDGVRNGRLTVGSGATVDGTLLYPAATGLSAADPSTYERGGITVEQGGRLRGVSFSASRTTVEGAVSGTIATHQLLLEHDGITFVNWLKDASVDVRARPTPFLLPVGFARHPRLDVLRWDTPSFSNEPLAEESDA